MPLLHRLNALQNELREVLRMDTADYHLEVEAKEVRARFINLRLHSAFQPVFDLASGKSAGYEALLRAFDQKGNALAPSTAFTQAEISGDLIKLDRLCRTLHTLNYLNMGNSSGLLFLNVHPELLVAVNSHGKVFERVLHNYALPTSGVVIELNESVVSRGDLLGKAIANYRERGYRIAIDDFGRDHSNLERLWTLSPQYVKLDGSYFRRAESDERLLRSLPRLVEIIHDLGAEVIVEGVETESQLVLSKSVGADLAQGYLLGPPASALSWDEALTLPETPINAPVIDNNLVQTA